MTADSSGSFDQLRRTTILWSRGGTFSEADTTQLPLPPIFGNSHIDYDVQRIDVNQDGLPDLILVGTQGQQPASGDGWFVQILVNKGNRQFVDETALRLSPGDASGGSAGVPTGAPWPMWVRVLDFNQDGALDFAVDFNSHGLSSTQDQPLVWINDGAGHFSTLKARDFVAAGSESLVVGGPRLMATRNGYGFIETRPRPGRHGLAGHQTVSHGRSSVGSDRFFFRLERDALVASATDAAGGPRDRVPDRGGIVVGRVESRARLDRQHGDDLLGERRRCGDVFRPRANDHEHWQQRSVERSAVGGRRRRVQRGAGRAERAHPRVEQRRHGGPVVEPRRWIAGVVHRRGRIGAGDVEPRSVFTLSRTRS